MLGRVSKHQVLPVFWSGHVWRDMGKSKRVEEQEPLYKVGMLPQATYVWLQTENLLIYQPNAQFLISTESR